MDILIEKSDRKIESVSVDFVRGLMQEIDWTPRLIGIKGARGVGKTTLLLQYLKMHTSSSELKLYVSLDNIWFADNKLVDVADWFVKRGGKHLFLDEVHKYPNWSQEIKNIYDDYPQLKIVFTGSSLLELLNAGADLSRRAVIYTMQGLSFREYLNIQEKTSFEKHTLQDILQNHKKIAKNIVKKTAPIKHFNWYIEKGYYPFFQEVNDRYHQQIEEVVNFILEVELPLLRQVNLTYTKKLKQLLLIIAESVPFMPNISKLSERIEINRNTLVTYLFYMQEAQLIKNLHKDAKGITRLQKPDKIYLENTNLLFALAGENTKSGNIRETFFINQLSYSHKVEYTKSGDFLINEKLTFEVGGKNKTKKQIQNVKNAYIAADNIELGFQHKIPLWLFGFLY